MDPDRLSGEHPNLFALKLPTSTMVYHRALRVILATLVHSLWTGAIPVQDGPVVQLDSATVLGIRQGSTLERFLGVPFAKPPYVYEPPSYY